MDVSCPPGELEPRQGGDSRTSRLVLCYNGFPTRTCQLSFIVFLEPLSPMHRTESLPAGRSESEKEQLSPSL